MIKKGFKIVKPHLNEMRLPEITLNIDQVLLKQRETHRKSRMSKLVLNPSFLCHFYVWGQIEPNSVDKYTIIEMEIFGHFGLLPSCCFPND